MATFGAYKTQISFFFTIMKKILVLLIPVLFPIFSSAWNGTTPENFSKTIPASEFSCNLPAPANLVVSNISAHSATGTWSAVPGAIGYVVEVRIASNNNLVYSNTTAALTETATSLPAGEKLNFIVAAICSNQEISSQSTMVEFTTDVVIEIVSVGYNPPCEGHNNQVIIQYAVPGNDVFEATVLYGQDYWLEISQNSKNSGEPVSFYRINYSEHGMTSYVCDFEENFNQTATPLGIVEGENEQGPYNQSSNWFDKIKVYNPSRGEHMVEIKLTGFESQLDDYGFIRVTAISEGWDEVSPGKYKIKFTSCGRGGEQRSSDRSNGSWLEMQPMNEKPLADINVFPNPVQSSLKLNLPENIGEGRILLTDINGRVVYQNTLVNYSNTGEIDVTDLQTGVYFLRIETEETSKVFKVFKSE